MTRFALLIACFALSGLAGLIYQTVWMQQFALVFGTSELALATVLAAYMTGLALGASAAGRWTGRVRRPILVYAGLELGIGLTALLIPAMIDAASRLQVVLLASDGLPEESIGSTLFYFLSSFLILLIPTSLMGATLPLLAHHAVHRRSQIGSRIGILYAANTAGAAVGTLSAAFLLLPYFGLGPTVWLAAAINVAVFLLAALLARSAPEPAVQPASSDRGETFRQGGPWILPLVLISGAVSFTWEILWTRLLSHLVGGSVYAFATMLATFLIGLTLGSALASRWASDAERARRGFAVAQIAVAALSIGAFVAADELPALARQWTGFDGWISSAGLAAVTLLPGAVAIGATFPLAVRVLARSAGDASRATARVFAWNTVGAIVGSLGAGYLLLPTLKFAGTAALATTVSLALALIASCITPPRRLLAAFAAAGLLAVVALGPETPWQVLRRGALSPFAVDGEIAHYGVGRSSTVLLIDEGASWRLTTNGLPESSIGARWQRPASQRIARWLTMLPHAVRPEIRSLLVVGLGGGVSTEDVPRSIEEIHVVELEPEVVRANRKISELRRFDPLTDPRLRLYSGDARGALRLTRQRFDAILSQPSHPWTSGAANLFTREYLELARARLTPSGVLIQWMGLTFVDETLLRSLVATTVDVFEHVELYQVGHAFLVLASPTPLDRELSAGRSLDDEPELWRRLGILCPEDLLATRVLDAEGARRFAVEGRVSTDFLNLFRTRAPRVLGRSALKPAEADQLLAPFEPQLASASDAERLYIVRRLIRQGAGQRALRVAEASADPITRRTAIGLAQLATGVEGAGELALREVLEQAPSDDPRTVEALHGLLIQRYRGSIFEGRDVPFTERFSDGPTEAVIAGWRASGQGNLKLLRSLEPRLTTIESHHPLFLDATRLRAAWRAASDQPEVAAQALKLLDSVLSPVPHPKDLILYARAAANADQPMTAMATIAEALPRLPRGSELAREAAQLLRRLDTNEDTDTRWLIKLQERLRQPA